jgi:hypothetical protein
MKLFVAEQVYCSSIANFCADLGARSRMERVPELKTIRRAVLVWLGTGCILHPNSKLPATFRYLTIGFTLF